MNDVTNQIDRIRTEILQRFDVIPPLAKIEGIINDTLAAKIDHTNLQPKATLKDIEKLCDEALEHGFFSVCIHPSFIYEARRHLENSKIKIATVVGFPFGSPTTETKVFETLDAIDQGAHEIDMVLNIGMLKSGELEDVYHDIRLVVQQAEATPVKVILETSALTLEEKIQGCILAQVSGAAFVKTSTGFGEHGATVEDVKLLKQIVGDSMGIKASGGIKTYASAKNIIEAGATRLGTSNSVSIIKESK